MGRPIVADLPYPSIDIITPDFRAAEIISPAYAAPHGEFTAVSQYIYHHFNFYKLGLAEISETLEDIAIAEMTHFDMLGKMLQNLGVNPIMSARPPQMCNFFSTNSVSFSTTPQKMIMDNITAEMDAINLYKSMLPILENEQVSAVIKRIILDEEMHVKIFKDILEKLTKDNI